MHKLRIASLAAAAFLNWGEEIFVAVVGSCTMVRTKDLYNPNPAMAPIVPSLPTVAVSIALPSRITVSNENMPLCGK